MPNQKINYVFIGSSNFSTAVLSELQKNNFLPSLIITTKGKAKGRGLLVQENIVKIWADKNGVPVIIPEKFNSEETEKILTKYDLALVASFGKIIGEKILSAPKMGTLNIHPSLLPKYRGASPLQSQILADEKNIGVTIIRLDKEMDHGPIIAEETAILDTWPVSEDCLSKVLAVQGARLFVNTLPKWQNREIKETEQSHNEATFTKKSEKSDGELDIINGDPYKNYLKFLAFSTWPGTYFFVEKDNKKIRVLIKDAQYQNQQFIIKTVVPEGKKEMSYDAFRRGLK